MARRIKNEGMSVDTKKPFQPNALAADTSRFNLQIGFIRLRRESEEEEGVVVWILQTFSLRAGKGFFGCQVPHCRQFL